MAYILRPGIRFCEASGRLVFLDLPRDRYLCLDQGVEQRLRQTVLSGSSCERDPMLDGLVRGGLLEQSERPAAPTQPPSLPEANISLMDVAGGARPPLPAIVRAGVAVVRARASLRRRGMAATIAQAAGQRARAGPGCENTAAIGRVAAAFARADRYLSPLDQCLPRSLALAATLARRGLAGRLVIGVRLRPFLAHSWVQTGRAVLNDRPDIVRTFVPILVI